MKFAVLTNGVIDNLIVAESKDIAESITNLECIELSDGMEYDLGWAYDAESGLFINPNS